ncbi:MAG: hypothetical protein B7X48_14495 [Acidiphilium sp. 34-60-192]|nr:MAG: hypothetical protein B7X48_14495 [Acidiphilium sp. 34-60-192]
MVGSALRFGHTFRRVFMLIDTGRFEACFESWARSFGATLDREGSQGLRMKDADRSLSMENGSRSNISNSVRLLEWQWFWPGPSAHPHPQSVLQKCRHRASH